MPLTSIIGSLRDARSSGYAIALFDAFDMRSAEAVFGTALEERAPVILGLYDSVMERPDTRAFCAYVVTRFRELPVPVSIMLDHGTGYDQCMKAISLGCTDLMFDGSKLPVDENAAITAEIVREAHSRGISVEAELGHVGSGRDYAEFGGKGEGFTDPAAAEAFVNETGVDILAVAIGTAHGQYEGEPRLDLDRLREIRKRVPVPLALHGGSGLSAEQFRDAIAAGISKINIATDLYAAAGRLSAESAASGERSYFALGEAASAGFRERCRYYLDLFGSAGRGEGT